MAYFISTLHDASLKQFRSLMNLFSKIEVDNVLSIFWVLEIFQTITVVYKTVRHVTFVLIKEL